MCVDHHGSAASSSGSLDTREIAFDSRRRSVDVGGLALALGTASLGDEHKEMGKGWGGWEEAEVPDAMYVISHVGMIPRSKLLAGMLNS